MDDESPPCNQDGVAAQADIEGLSKNRVRVPSEQKMKEMGFNEYLCRGGKDAHFIGNFKWIFALKKEDLGYIIR
jgi:hypothetical protein